MVNSNEMKNDIMELDYADLIELEYVIKKAKSNIAKRGFLNDLESLLDAFEKSENELNRQRFEDLFDNDWFSKSYPFEKSFDEVCFDVRKWINTLKESV